MHLLTTDDLVYETNFEIENAIYNSLATPQLITMTIVYQTKYDSISVSSSSD